jgi:oligopeptide transport system ATP-binding protein
MQRKPITGDVPSQIHPPSGCRPKRFAPSDQIRPTLAEVEKGHFVPCHLYSN